MRALHLCVPYAIRSAAVRDPATAGRLDTLGWYDMATAALVLGTGRTGRVVGASAATAAVCLEHHHPGRIVAVAASEEMLWRTRTDGPGGTAASIFGFALLHAPVARHSWRYHLATGGILSATARRHGVGAAIIVHAAHNLWLQRRARQRGQLHVPEQTHGPRVRHLPSAGEWPLSDPVN